MYDDMSKILQEVARTCLVAIHHLKTNQTDNFFIIFLVNDFLFDLLNIF